MKKFWKDIVKVRVFFQASVVFFILSLVLYAYFSSETYNNVIFNRFQNGFLREQNELLLRLDNLTDQLSNRPFEAVYSRKVREFRDLAQDRSMYLFVYLNDSLVLWSDNRIAEMDMLSTLHPNNRLLQLSNGWFYTESRKAGAYTILGLLLVKNNYLIQNQHLNNSFNPIFNIPANTIIHSSVLREKYVLLCNDGTKAFSVNFPSSIRLESWNNFVVLSFFLLSFTFLILGYRKFVRLAENTRQKLLYVFLLGCIFIGIKLAFSVFHVPAFLYQLNLFKPAHFALGNIVPSLGDLLLYTTLLYFVIYFAYTEIHTELSGKIKNIYLKDFIRFVALLVLAFYFLLANQLFEKVVNNSSLNLDMQEIIRSGFVPIFGIVSIAMLFAVFIFLLDYVYRTFFITLSFRKCLIFTFSTFALVLGAYFTSVGQFSFPVILVLGGSASLIIIIRKKYSGIYKYIHVIVMVLLFSTYSVFIIYQVSSEKLSTEQKILASNLSNEHDPVAEYLIFDLGKKFTSDTSLCNLCTDPMIDYPYIYKYIRKRYFSGYWERYDLQLTICKPDDSVLIKPQIQYQHCFSFFTDLVEHSAVRLPGTDFYFMQNANGRISYLSALHLLKTGYSDANVYMQLDSRLNAEELGYPEILIDQRYMPSKNKNDYSYAKYYKDRLSYQSGNFLYNINANKYPIGAYKFSAAQFGGFDHLFFRSDADNILILSKPAIRIFDLTVSFSYLFIFYFLLLNLMLLAASPQWLKLPSGGGFKTRIRLSVVGILLLSLITVASITIYFIFEQYSNKQSEEISEKLQSVYLELENNLATETQIKYTWSSHEHNNLEELLKKLSNVFSTDINIYDVNGKMIASSRSEIFDKGLSGIYMNPMALYQLSFNNKAEFIQNEWLGDQKYISIYTPFVNNQNQLIAFLNLPYFGKQNAIKKEVTTMLLAIINFYVIFILLSLSIAIVISDKIAKPLKMIQDRLSTIRLGKQSEKIEYLGNDEISSLVNQYNSMVDELEQSAEQLAKSERELAWREMAKQVAHEIKNPLTPMKLSIQQLQRAWHEKKSEDLNDYFTRVTKTLIEQIDNLSAIATEFSNFAKMPKANNVTFNLNELVTDTLLLFDKNSNTNIHISPSASNLFVHADKEQLSRVLMNLITNAIQSVTDGQKAHISIGLSSGKTGHTIRIKDNGIGISDEIFDKLFQPNFTTKSSGMGLGLAICKNIIENAGGKIFVEQTNASGTVFRIDLPAV